MEYLALATMIEQRTTNAPASATTHKIRTAAFVGPPNSGKSTLFNRLTNLRQNVSNYPGTTVELRTGSKMLRRSAVTLIDLPGIYNLTPNSEDERVTLDVLNGRVPGVPKPDLIVLVLDATNLARHLALAAPMIALGIPTLTILNMSDLLAKRFGAIDTVRLAGELGTPVALISATQGTGLTAVEDFLEQGYASSNKRTLPIIYDPPRCRRWAGEIVGRAAYRAPAPPIWTRRLDNLTLHKFLGPTLFALVIVCVFQVVFEVGQPLSNALQALLSALGKLLGSSISNDILRSIVIEGIWNGSSAVLVFLPQILVLFLFIGLLEDSGYLARAALISDRAMKSVGLNGRAFIPLLSAYACAVPAIMATRTMADKRDRLTTILIAPFMTCSARLPIYTLVISAFVPERPLLGVFMGTRAFAMLILYVLGFAAAVGTAKLLKSSILRSERIPFVLELPEYRLPTPRSVGLRLLDRSYIFVRQVGTVILCVSFAVWCLTALPFHDGHPPQLEQSAMAHIGHIVEPTIRPLGFDWKIGLGLLTSAVAREAIVGTLATLYGSDPSSKSMSLQTALRHDLELPGAIALVVFFAFAMQCTSTLAVVRRETGGWKWPILKFLYMTTLAYFSSLAVNQFLKLALHS